MSKNRSDDFNENNKYNNHTHTNQSDSAKINRNNGNTNQSDKDIYSLSNLSNKEKAIFSFNVTINVIRRLLLYFVVGILMIIALGGGISLGYFANLVSESEPPTQEEMMQQINHYDQQSTMFYRDGQQIANIQSDVVRSAVPLDQISPYIVDGLIATEDEYFYSHPGVMPKAIIRALLQTLVTGSGTGGSTLTQQLVKQQMLSHDITFFRKANEILLAMRLEHYFSKDEILNAYLNVSPFGRNFNGDNVAGIEKASEGIFGKKASEVNLNQAAFLVGLPQDPYSYTPYTQDGQFTSNFDEGIHRMKEVLFRMYREEKITKEQYDEALAYDITKDFKTPEPREKARQTYLYQAVMNAAIEKLMAIEMEENNVDFAKIYDDDSLYNEYYHRAEEALRTGGYHVYTTIDKQIYDQLQASAAKYEDELGVTYDGLYTDPDTGEEIYYVEKVQTGMVVIDNPTGSVLGFISGTDYENNQIDHAFGTRRSPGSTIKPLAVYGPAIDTNVITPATIIPDTEFIQTFDDGSTWAPTNYGQAISGGFISAREALFRSDNLPAIRIYKELLDRKIPVLGYLKKMGFDPTTSYTEEETQNLAFSLGGVTQGPTIFEETRAFTTFANNGEYIEGHLISKIEDAFGNVIFEQKIEPERVFSEDSNYLMIDMLRDTMTQGTGRTARANMEMDGDWIAKTGISENSKDIWVLASTPKITIGSWIGYDSKYKEYTIDVNDGFGLESVRSQNYWAKIVNDLYKLRPEIFGTEMTFKQPDSIVKTPILEKTGTLPGSISINGVPIMLNQPLREDLFKVSHPAPPLSYDFMVGADEELTNRFWNQLKEEQIQKQLKELELQRQQQQQQSSSSSNQNTNESHNENETNNTNENTNRTTPTP